jgi:hypothetical protein
LARAGWRTHGAPGESADRAARVRLRRLCADQAREPDQHAPGSRPFHATSDRDAGSGRAHQRGFPPDAGPGPGRGEARCGPPPGHDGAPPGRRGVAVRRPRPGAAQGRQSVDSRGPSLRAVAEGPAEGRCRPSGEAPAARRDGLGRHVPVRGRQERLRGDLSGESRLRRRAVGNRSRDAGDPLVSWRQLSADEHRLALTPAPRPTLVFPSRVGP